MARNVQAFARAKAMFAQITAALAMPAGLVRELALDAIPAYRSRGKGRGGAFMGSSAHCVAHDKRAARKARCRANHKRACRG